MWGHCSWRAPHQCWMVPKVSCSQVRPGRGVSACASPAAEWAAVVSPAAHWSLFGSGEPPGPGTSQHGVQCPDSEHRDRLQVVSPLKHRHTSIPKSQVDICCRIQGTKVLIICDISSDKPVNSSQLTSCQGYNNQQSR